MPETPKKTDSPQKNKGNDETPMSDMTSSTTKITDAAKAILQDDPSAAANVAAGISHYFNLQDQKTDTDAASSADNSNSKSDKTVDSADNSSASGDKDKDKTEDSTDKKDGNTNQSDEGMLTLSCFTHYYLSWEFSGCIYTLFANFLRHLHTLKCNLHTLLYLLHTFRHQG